MAKANYETIYLLYLFFRNNFVEMDDNEVGLCSPLKVFNDLEYIHGMNYCVR